MNSNKWPSWSSDLIKSEFPVSSLLSGTEPTIWNALGRLEHKDFDNGKQVTVRKALKEIGLGWVATNTTPFRISIGGMFDAAEKCHRESEQCNGYSQTNTETNRKPVPTICVNTQSLPDAQHRIDGPIDKDAATQDNRKAVWEQLNSYGAYVIRNAISSLSLQERLKLEKDSQTKLSHTMGNGLAGDPTSVYADLSEKPKWHDELEQTIGKLLIGPGAPEEFSDVKQTLKRKSILLLGGEGGENWAHQDGNDQTPPVQAMLLLSTPQKDFNGGEFYVAKQTKNTDEEINIVRYTISFESPGDLVIFMAGKNSGWWHGMLPVKAGEEQKPKQEHLRRAVGMLQPTD